MSEAGSTLQSDFQYVVERIPPQPICFGSQLHRSTAPIGKDLSAYQRRYVAENFSKIGPGCYEYEKFTSSLNQVLNKIRSKKGVGPLISAVPRFTDKILMTTPAPTKYAVNPDWGAIEKAWAPFGSNTTRKTYKENNNPGPGTHDITSKKCRKTKYKYNFGRPKLVEAVEEICIPEARDVCLKCGKICPSDYWQRSYEMYLCHICWEEEKHTRENYQENELKEFQKIRNCIYKHDHQSTTAKIHLLPQSNLNTRLTLENYLNLYLKC